MTDSIEQNGVPVKKGVLELFAYLKEAGLPMALATSSYRPSYERLFRVTGLEDPFSVVITGGYTGTQQARPGDFLARGARLERAHQRVLDHRRFLQRCHCRQRRRGAYGHGAGYGAAHPRGARQGLRDLRIASRYHPPY